MTPNDLRVEAEQLAGAPIHSIAVGVTGGHPWARASIYVDTNSVSTHDLLKAAGWECTGPLRDGHTGEVAPFLVFKKTIRHNPDELAN